MDRTSIPDIVAYVEWNVWSWLFVGSMISSGGTAEEVETLSSEGQKMLDAISSSPKPTVAAIMGSCLGGGLEVSSLSLPPSSYFFISLRMHAFLPRRSSPSLVAPLPPSSLLSLPRRSSPFLPLHKMYFSIPVCMYLSLPLRTSRSSYPSLSVSVPHSCLSL